MKIVTSMTILTTPEGKRMSVTYSDVDESGKITSENNRENRIVVRNDVLEHISVLELFAQEIVEG